MTTTGKPLSDWALTIYGLMPNSIIETVEDARSRGQPYMDNLVLMLIDYGANTPEQNLETMKHGLLKESWQNRLLTDRERRDIWRRYRVPPHRRLVYRTRAWWRGRTRV